MICHVQDFLSSQKWSANIEIFFVFQRKNIGSEYQ